LKQNKAVHSVNFVRILSAVDICHNSQLRDIAMQGMFPVGDQGVD